ncbi:MAG: hypothetical protein LBK75_05270, partial [Oscillospiraceae bacterium]|nr:hypothetical protein [Oscillospiraceae bacterium]
MKTRTRAISFVLAFVMLLTVTAVGVWAAQISSVATASGPLDMQVTLQEGDPFVFMKNEYKAAGESFWQTESAGGDTAVNFSNVSESSLLSGTTWGDSLQDEWEQIPQRVAVPVQRYIVKYKEGEEAQAREMVAPL